ncbi:hypothetical protein BU24DRAFT_423587 [Aaosphaeria arxii CBS 175.79]|uniref:Uncharacterized protein n=1 Tax=Aaosphaeria arxii CBS 175.79 TaxID=1450172 RepID=A0A6A5XP61_9PLEO|nr:uncharacterized protein BU24DRAFT_423587 [Aaosphaeria arxii CBS 175.79]KAF2014689.1 hypothetical protein BU24DRAFT_423587 [Aaosphaeria arxii CBS 175.79]
MHRLAPLLQIPWFTLSTTGGLRMRSLRDPRKTLHLSKIFASLDLLRLCCRSLSLSKENEAVRPKLWQRSVAMISHWWNDYRTVLKGAKRLLIPTS